MGEEERGRVWIVVIQFLAALHTLPLHFCRFTREAVSYFDLSALPFLSRSRYTTSQDLLSQSRSKSRARSCIPVVPGWTTVGLTDQRL
jgi:hypothetical protein